MNTYKGFVSGMKSTQVRLTITNGSIEGAILTANGHYFIQPARSLSKTARKDEFIFYNSEDVTYDPDMRSLTLADQVAVEQERARAYVDKSTGQITSTNIVAPSPPRTQVMEFTVDPNSRVAGRRAFLLIGASLGGQMGGLSIPITQSGSGPDCPLTPIAFGETINGALSNTDCRSPISGADFDFADRYVFNATADQEVVVLASIAGNFTSNVTLIGPTGRILLTGVLAEFFHTRIPGGKGTLNLGLAVSM